MPHHHDFDFKKFPFNFAKNPDKKKPGSSRRQANLTIYLYRKLIPDRHQNRLKMYSQAQSIQFELRFSKKKSTMWSNIKKSLSIMK